MSKIKDYKVQSNETDLPEIVNSFIEIKLNSNEEPKDAFLKVKETLTRIGIANHNKKTITQTAHILQKRGKYYLVHFLELFELDGKETNFNETDKERVWVIAKLLKEWGMIDIISTESEEYMNNLQKPFSYGLHILPYSQKKEWNLKSNYTIGG